MEVFNPKKMLVTGGAGFIGSNYIHHMLSADSDIKIVNLDVMTYAADQRNLDDLPDPGRYSFVRGDITDRSVIERLFDEHNFDCVVHFAAESHVDRSIAGPEAFVRTNIVGTFNLLEVSRQHWEKMNCMSDAKVRFHHISTDEVYGTLDESQPAFTEKSLYSPNSPYSASKAGSDHFVRAYRHTYGLPVTTSNCSNNYGPRQHAEKLIPKIIESCRAGASIPVYGDGRNIRDWLYVADHCEAIDLIVRRGTPGETYNIGGDTELRNIEIVNRICSLMDKIMPKGAPHSRLINFVKDRPGHDWRYAIDFSHLTRSLGWRPRYSFEEGILRTIEWYSK